MPFSGAGLASGLQRRLGWAANAVLALGAAVCFGVVGRALAELHGGVGLDQIVTFYVLPAVVGVAFASTFKLSPGTRINLALLLAAVAVTLLSVEALLLVTARGQDGLPLSSSDDAVEARSLHEVVIGLRSGGDHAYPRVPGNVLVSASPELTIDSVVKHPLTPAPGGATVVLCNEAGEEVAYRGDRFGFDNSDAVWDLDQPELALIGDSYAHGVCVDGDDGIAAHLRARWNTLNLGVSGAGPLLELAILREYVAPSAPFVVVWLYFEGNDLYDLEQEASHAWLLDYLQAEHRQGLRGKHVAINSEYALWLDSLVAAGPSPLTGRAASPGLSQLAREVPRLRTLRALARFGVAFPSRRPPLELLRTVLLRAKKDVEAWDGRLLLVYMPSFIRYDVWAGSGASGHDEVLALSRDEGIPLVDLDETFTATGDPRDLWAHPRGHLAPEGYRIAARAIAAAVDSLRAES